MRRIIFIAFAALLFLSCNENVENKPEEVKSELNQIQATETESLFVDSLPNPVLLIDESLIKTKYPDYDESKCITKSDNVKGILAVRRKLNEGNEEPVIFLRLSVSKNKNPDLSLRNKIDNLKNYSLVDGLGFDAAWNPELKNLNFLHKNYIFNLIISDDSKSDAEKLEIAQSFAKIIMQRADNLK